MLIFIELSVPSTSLAATSQLASSQLASFLTRTRHIASELDLQRDFLCLLARRLLETLNVTVIVNERNLISRRNVTLCQLAEHVCVYNALGISHKT
jgi:hypothetical protein